MTQQTDNAQLHEIATLLGCHRGLIIQTITKLLADLKDRDTKLLAIKLFTDGMLK